MPRLTDALALAGFAALTLGLWLLSPALALIVAGLLLLTAGILAHYAGAPPRRPRRTPHVTRPYPARPPGSPDPAS